MTAVSTAAAAMRERAAQWIERLHDDVVGLFTELDQGGTFRSDSWDRDGGGGGTARVLIDGTTFEKAGINRSRVDGILPPEAARRLGGTGAAQGTTHFYATGVSLVVHPRSPMIPTVHLNVRYFELSNDNGETTDVWFGGGTDLTPTYPFEEDAVFFHRTLKDICDRHHPSLHPRFKKWCDDYFTNTHRDGEARGVGGIFYDHVRPLGDESGLNANALFAFADDVGRSLRSAYGPIVERRRDTPYGERERNFQLQRRGRYVEFNLLHDRGTIFGLQTNARVESVLMSLPPLAAWHYAPVYEPGSFEAHLIGMLRPQDWSGAG